MMVAEWPWPEPMTRAQRRRYRLMSIAAPPQKGEHRNACPCQSCYEARLASFRTTDARR